MADLWNGKVKLRIHNTIRIICYSIIISTVVFSCVKEKNATTFILVTPSEGVTLLVQDVPCIDIRPLTYRDSGFITSSRSIPLNQQISLDSILNTYHREKSLLIYNQTGTNYDEIKSILSEKGFSKVYLLLGGFKSWQHQGLEITNN